MSTFSHWRRRTYGPRCASPPTFVCYELPQPESYSRSSSPTSSDHYSGDECYESDSESRSNSDEEQSTTSMSSNIQVVERMTMVDAGEPQAIGDAVTETPPTVVTPPAAKPEMEVDPKDIPCPSSGNEDEDEEAAERRRAEKREGKKKEVVDVDMADTEKVAPPSEERQPEQPKPKERKKRTKRRRREHAPEIRPILTIRSSQGFVWNQDLFVPPYIKDRYIATSPPSSYPRRSSNIKSNLVNNNFFSTSNEADYEVECVEIHVDETELEYIIPRN